MLPPKVEFIKYCESSPILKIGIGGCFDWGRWTYLVWYLLVHKDGYMKEAHASQGGLLISYI
jgi:hypothetical protein